MILVWAAFVNAGVVLAWGFLNPDPIPLAVSGAAGWVAAGTYRWMVEKGSSRTLEFFSDGDGDYHPRFKWDVDIEPVDAATGLLWDAG